MPYPLCANALATTLLFPAALPPQLPCEQIRRTGTTHELRNSSRRHWGRSRWPPHADLPRARCRTRSPPQGQGSLPEWAERRMRDNTRPPKRERSEVFQSGAGPRGGVCAVCLGRHEHTFAKCENTRLWDGSASGARKNEQGRLVTSDRTSLCFDWQLPKGCGSTSHMEKHRCAGCGRTDHGAQGCHRAEKA